MRTFYQEKLMKNVLFIAITSGSYFSLVKKAVSSYFKLGKEFLAKISWISMYKIAPTTYSGVLRQPNTTNAYLPRGHRATDTATSPRQHPATNIPSRDVPVASSRVILKLKLVRETSPLTFFAHVHTTLTTCACPHA